MSEANPGKGGTKSSASKSAGGSALSQTKPGVGPGAGQAPPQGANPMTPLLVMLLMIMVLTSSGLRQGLGDAAGAGLEPLLGFDNQWPLITIWLAGLVMVTLTTLIRHFAMDWAKMAEVQQKMGAYQKELKKARQDGNMARMQKIMKANQTKVMAIQTEMSSNQMKPMMFTMFIAIPIFMWLYSFIDGQTWHFASLPWEPKWGLEDRLWFLPHWIVLYSLMSLPFGQALQRGLKLVSFSGELRRLNEADSADQLAKSLEKSKEYGSGKKK